MSHTASKFYFQKEANHGSLPTPKKKNRHSSPPGKGPSRSLTSQKVFQAALTTLTQHLTLPRPASAQYGPCEVFAPVLYAATHRTTIEQACLTLAHAPHANTVQGASAPLPLEQVEAELNAALATTWPKGLLRHLLEVTLDLKLIPYYGEPRPGEEDFGARTATGWDDHLLRLRQPVCYQEEQALHPGPGHRAAL